MQTILGSGGAIGTELAKALYAYTKDIRLVSRHPKKVNDSDQLFPADLTNPEQLNKAIAGSEVCYVTIGFEYKTSVWHKQWVPFVQHLIASCEKNNCRLVFFDNIYALDKEAIHDISESSAMNPTTKKGKVRAEIDALILKAIEEKRIDAIIARSPDFFGMEKKQNSLLMNLIYDNFVKGKAAQWFGNANIPHSMGFTPDLAKGTAMLGNQVEAYNQIWNLPVSDEVLNGKQWAELFAKEMNVNNKLNVMPSWMLKVLGIFIPVLGEMYEMSYQYEKPYVFNAQKFKRAFNFTPTSNQAAVKWVVDGLKTMGKA